MICVFLAINLEYGLRFDEARGNPWWLPGLSSVLQSVPWRCTVREASKLQVGDFRWNPTRVTQVCGVLKGEGVQGGRCAE